MITIFSEIVIICTVTLTVIGVHNFKNHLITNKGIVPQSDDSDVMGDTQEPEPVLKVCANTSVPDKSMCPHRCFAIENWI